jgi:hypothetical protein
MGTKDRLPYLRMLFSTWRVFAPYTATGSVMIACLFIWQGHALKPVVVTAIFFFMAMMLAPTLGALIVIASLAASSFRL